MKHFKIFIKSKNMKNYQTIAALEKSLAASYFLMLKTHSYHWNVVGENFKSLHELFQVQYEEIFAAIDEIAERIRALGSKVDGSFSAFESLLKTHPSKPANKDFSTKEMLADLISDNELMALQLSGAIKIAQNEEDEVSADLFIGRAAAHQKAVWMLSASKN